MINPFFKNKVHLKLKIYYTLSNTGNKNNYTGSKIIDIKDLVTATNNDITFFHSKKYESTSF